MALAAAVAGALALVDAIAMYLLAIACRGLISYVTDRPGHDHRYAINAAKLASELGERCSVGFETGLEQTVRWYLDHEHWWRDVTSGAYKAWIDKNYGFRIAV